MEAAVWRQDEGILTTGPQAPFNALVAGSVTGPISGWDRPPAFDDVLSERTADHLAAAELIPSLPERAAVTGA